MVNEEIAEIFDRMTRLLAFKRMLVGLALLLAEKLLADVKKAQFMTAGNIVGFYNDFPRLT